MRRLVVLAIALAALGACGGDAADSGPSGVAVIEVALTEAQLASGGPAVVRHYQAEARAYFAQHADARVIVYLFSGIPGQQGKSALAWHRDELAGRGP